MAGVGSQVELFDLAHDFFTEVSTQQPLLLVLEDLHWSDPASLELLRYLGRSIGQAAIMLIASYRHEEIVRSHPLYALLPLIVRESHAQRMQLTRLDRDTVREMIEGDYALNHGDTARLIAYVWQRAEGNPFFVDELLQGMQAEQVLQPSEDGWRLGDLDEAHLPPLLLQVLDARLDHLSPETHRALQVAAVIGQEMPLDLWQTVGQLDSADLDQAIAEALEARVLKESGKMRGLHFRHALLREALYESLVLSRRRALHRQIGDLLAATASPDLDAVAHHFQQAGDDRAVDWFIRAGERAIRLYAWKIGVERFETALQLLEAAGTDLAQQGWLHYRIGRHLRYAEPELGIAHLEVAERLARAGSDRVLAAFALADRGMLRCFALDIRRGLDELLAGDEALEALEADGIKVDDELLIWIADALPTVDAPTSSGENRWAWGINIRRGGLVTRLAMAGRYHEALAFGEPYAERIATLSRGDGILLAALQDVQLGLGAAYADFGRPAEAREAFGQARAAYEQIDHYRLVGNSALNELYRVVLPYQTTRIDERRRLVDIAQASLQRARGIFESDRPRYPPLYLPLLLLEGRWDTAHDVTGVSLGSMLSDERWAAMVATGELARHQGHPDLGWQQVHVMLPAGPESEPGGCDILSALSLQRLAADLLLDDGNLGRAAELDQCQSALAGVEWRGARPG